MAEMASETRLSAWGGGGTPYAISSKKLGMWLFLVSDTLTFSALLIAYSYVRVANENWPRPFDGHSILLATVMTFCLLSSSLTMVHGGGERQASPGQANRGLASGYDFGRVALYHPAHQ